MPLKLNLGLQKKIGLPDYGSVGASCHVEFELDGSLITQDLESFHRHVRNAYIACSQAVSDELARQQAGHYPASSCPDSTPVKQPPVNGHSANGRHPANGASNLGNGTGQGAAHQASQKQMDYLQQLARQVKGLGVRRLEELAERMFGKPLAAISSLEASSLIDQVKAIKAGTIAMDGILGNGVPT